MVSNRSKQKALALKEIPRIRTRDCEYDIYTHLQEKNRVVKTGTEKFNYFNTLLQDLVVKDPKADPELVQFMDGLYSIVQSRVHQLQEQNRENTPEENITEEDEVDDVEMDPGYKYFLDNLRSDGDNDDDVTMDPGYKYFLDHLRPHGESYVLDIPEYGIFVEYECESSIPESTDNANHVSNEEVNMRLDTDLQGGKAELSVIKSPNVVSNSHNPRGKKPKGDKLSSARNGNVKSSDVASKAQKHADNCTIRRRSKRLRKQAMKTNNSFRVAEGGIVEIEDSDDEASKSVGYRLKEYNEANAITLFKEKLMEELKVPYCEDEHKRLLYDISVRKPVQHHKDLRGRIKIYEEDYPGFSFLDHHVDLAEKIDSLHDDYPRVLNLLRGFFYWVKNLSHEGAFMPWKDDSCLDVLPQQ